MTVHDGNHRGLTHGDKCTDSDCWCHNSIPAFLQCQPQPLSGPLSESTASAKALTYDDGKAPLASLPWAGLDSMANVQAYGHKKYGDFYNYRKGMEVSRNLSCAIRHIRDFMDGADLDPESGESHLGHAMTRLAYVLQNMKDGTVIDDRYSKRKPL